MKFPKQIKKWRAFGRKFQLFHNNSTRVLGFERVPGGARPTLNQKTIWLGPVLLLVQG